VSSSREVRERETGRASTKEKDGERQEKEDLEKETKRDKRQ